MKARITENGILEIERPAKYGAMEYKQMRCVHNYERFCGDDCPAFDDPEINMDENEKPVEIGICSECARVGYLCFDYVLDERNGKEYRKERTEW